MAYDGSGVAYLPTDFVAESAEVTEMMGQASGLNQQQDRRQNWRESPTKSLVALWFFIVILYLLLGFFFRRYVV